MNGLASAGKGGPATTMSSSIRPSGVGVDLGMGTAGPGVGAGGAHSLHVLRGGIRTAGGGAC
jgi:hypothetical protein